ncbi:hypothetical protein D9M68_911710 [compost metagenome]
MAFFIAARIGIAEDFVGLVGIVVGLAVGGGRTSGKVGLAIEVRAGVARVVGAGADQLLNHLVAGLQIPDGILASAFHATQGA